jgi:hypothetical protein
VPKELPENPTPHGPFNTEQAIVGDGMGVGEGVRVVVGCGLYVVGVGAMEIFIGRKRPNWRPMRNTAIIVKNTRNMIVFRAIYQITNNKEQITS